MYGFLKTFLVTLVFGLGLSSFAFASSVVVESHHAKVHFFSSKSLPKGPNPTVEANCAAYTATDLTQTSKTVRDRGWMVTSQVQVLWTHLKRSPRFMTVIFFRRLHGITRVHGATSING